MKGSIVLPALLYASSVLAVIPLSDVKKVTTIPTVANKFIIEVDTVSDIPTKRSAAAVRERFYASLTERDIAIEVDKEYDSEIFVGAAITLSNTDDIVEIANSEGIKDVRPVRIYPRPAPVKFEALGSDAEPDLQSSHVMTGVDKVHALGVTGAGVKIGIFDTGIDYTHPALGGGFGPGFKVVGGFDFVGDDYNGSNDPVPDPDPLDLCGGHGTHVAGIIAADPNNPFNISGVAYGADISAYRIFGCVGFVTDAVIIESLLVAYADGQDIFTLSLGGSDGWTEGAGSVVASRIAATGKIVTIAAGNEGSAGSWYTSSPANGIDVISVASVDNIAITLQTAIVSGVEHDPIVYYELFPWPITDALPIYAISNSTTVVDDACSPLPDATPDLSGFLVIVRRGTCTFVQKLQNIAEKGGQIALIYDNGSGFGPISVGGFNASLIQAADGEFLVSQYAAGVSVTISFPQTGGSTQFPDPAGGLVSAFSTYGPTNDFYFKPAVAAPGGNILSTIPTTLGTYGLASGTSMATPFVAGAAALLFSVKGKSREVGLAARDLFETTAQKIPSSFTDADPLQTVTQQGAGLVDVFKAIYGETIVSPGELILNDTAHFAGEHEFTVVNTGSIAKTYTLSHVPAGTAQTVTPGTIFVARGPVPLTSASASVSFSTDSFTLDPGASRTITATITPPSGQDASTFPVYSGFIDITADGSDITHVTYLGLAASLIDKKVLDETGRLFGFEIPVILDENGNVQTEPTNYTFVGDSWPAILFRFAFGTPTLAVDLVNSDATLDSVTSIAKRQDETARLTFYEPQEGSSFAEVSTVGSLAEFQYLPRNDESNDPYNILGLIDPVFANGTQIPNGLYKILVRVLRVTGDPGNNEDYESWLSPIVGVAV